MPAGRESVHGYCVERSEEKRVGRTDYTKPERKVQKDQMTRHSTAAR